jgi:hypothetical protein
MVPIAASSLSATSRLTRSRLRVFKPRAVSTERLDARRQFILVAIGIAPPFDRALQRLERGAETACRGFDISHRF